VRLIDGYYYNLKFEISVSIMYTLSKQGGIMSGKLFIQIVALIIIFVVIMNAAKCLKKAYCPMLKSKCAMCESKSRR